jgi:signal peptidase I
MQVVNGSALARGSLVLVRAFLIAGIALTLFIGYGLVDNAWYRVLAVRGGSMEPTIGAGDMIVITRPPAHIETGMVLTLQVDGAVVTHRVVEVTDDGSFVTQGDANDVRDDFSANDVRIVGVYRFSLPVLGGIIDFLASGAWFGRAEAAVASVGSGTWESPLDPVPIMVDGPLITWRPAAPASPGPTQSPGATESSIPSLEPTASEAPTASAEPSPAGSASESVSPTASPVDETTPSAEPTPAETPAPSGTPSPSPEPGRTFDPVP